jgi:chromate transport protein ChrA
MAFRMAMAIKHKPFFLPFTLLVFIAIALLRWPLPAVMLAGIALSGAVAYGLLKKEEGGEGRGMSTLLELFTEFALLSFVAFGGATALLPELYRVVVENHRWMDATTFAHLYAIAQAAPGPNVLVVTLIGWQVAGLAGALTATVAMCLPMSVVVYLLFGHWDRFKGALAARDPARRGAAGGRD